MFQWVTGLFASLKGGGTAPASTRIGLAIEGGAIALGVVMIALKMLWSADISENALILIAMLLLTGLALIQAGKSHEDNSGKSRSADSAAGVHDVSVQEQGTGADGGATDGEDCK